MSAILKEVGGDRTATVGDLVEALVESDFDPRRGDNSGRWRQKLDYDAAALSEFIYFTQVVGASELSRQVVFLYLAYNVVQRALREPSFNLKRLRRVLNLGQFGDALIKTMGQSDLLVVKQHILRYEATEIAHIENVMKGETRFREHRYLDRFEETLLYESETSTESEKELESQERFEMNRETSRTIKEDQKFSADVSISAKYGPTSIASNAAYALDVSESSEVTTAATYAKDITDRSLQRVNERIRSERITKIVKENETTNRHSFTNIPVEGSTSESTHVSGVYQFVDKIYRAQVFNYGKRATFDLMVPEPASYLWHVKQQGKAASGEKLEAPDELPASAMDLSFGEDGTGLADTDYAQLAAKYRATGIEQPPLRRKIHFSHEVPGSDATDTEPAALLPEDGGASGYFFYPPKILDIELPEGYVPSRVHAAILGFSDSGPQRLISFVFAVGSAASVEVTAQGQSPPDPLRPRLEAVQEGGGLEVYSGSATLHDSGEIGDSEKIWIGSADGSPGSLKVSYSPRDSANHSLSFEIECVPTPELLDSWRLDTYEKLQKAYQDRLLEHQSEVAKREADRRAQADLSDVAYGLPPGKQRQIMLTELKKHAIAMLSDNVTSSTPFTDNDPLVPDARDPEELPRNPPQIDREKAMAQGDLIRFFEHAFEWAQMQYALYPYFWLDQQKWPERFPADDPNYEYQQFLQAGAARLVLAVRLGFEEAVAHYLETGQVWNGEGPPSVDSPLYLAIVDEIRERSDELANNPIP